MSCQGLPCYLQEVARLLNEGNKLTKIEVRRAGATAYNNFVGPRKREKIVQVKSDQYYLRKRGKRKRGASDNLDLEEESK